MAQWHLLLVFYCKSVVHNMSTSDRTNKSDTPMHPLAWHLHRIYYVVLPLQRVVLQNYLRLFSASIPYRAANISIYSDRMQNQLQMSVLENRLYVERFYCCAMYENQNNSRQCFFANLDTKRKPLG